VLVAAVVAGCGSGELTAAPTIGSPAPVVESSSPATPGAVSELARTWNLTGVDLPADWPDIPLPKGTEVVTAYAIGDPPRRTWSATFTKDTGTALQMAGPVVAALQARGYTPIAAYSGEAQTNTGLFSFAAPTFAVYVVLGEDDGLPNVTITVRGTTEEDAGLPAASSSAAATSPGTAPSSATSPTAPATTPAAPASP
jgi:hypothetical protein